MPGMTHLLLSALLALALGSGLGGCGYKGPLQLPQESAPPQAQAQQE